VIVKSVSCLNHPGLVEADDLGDSQVGVVFGSSRPGWNKQFGARDGSRFWLLFMFRECPAISEARAKVLISAVGWISPSKLGSDDSIFDSVRMR
jgi:hypothetical protein